MSREPSVAEQAANPPSASRQWLRALELTSRLGEDPHRTFPVLLDDLGERFGAAPALLSDDESLSFEDLAARARRYARWALMNGFERGDAVALLMPNRPDYVAAWAGLSRAGCIVALLNTNLRGTALAHSLSVAGARAVIVDARLHDRLEGALPHLAEPPAVVVHGDSGTATRRIDIELTALNDRRFGPAELPAVTLSDPALYIYTSGTTGLPKAARVSHRRVVTWSFWFAGLIGAGPEDRIYDCLPLYHSVGGIVAVGSLLVGGGSVVIQEKFSASRFWDDIVRWDCTLFQYIGELCRYLLAADPAPAEARHRLRLACGNGLKGEVWPAFQQRFAVPRILEFYAATEGSFSLVNVEGEVGSIGRIPPILAHRFPAAIVRYDADRGEPARGPDGFCIRCARDEPGEAIGLIVGRDGTHGGAFEGYTDAAESGRKVLRDVFKPGDRWFRTGDLMRQDKRGFFYFVDRIGDTFRWKGENVAASEVAAAIAACPGVAEATVYGVAVPGADGRAGMAAIVPGDGFALDALHRHLEERLPSYARPLVLRLQASLDITETFKHKKGLLAGEGFDPMRVHDPLYLDDARRGAYVPLDAALHADIVAGRLRL